MPKPSATGTSVLAFARAITSAKRACSASRSPVVPTTDTAYRKPRALAPIAARRSGGVVGATSGTRARSRESHAPRSSAASSRGRSGTISPHAPDRARRSRNRSAPGAKTMFA